MAGKSRSVKMDRKYVYVLVASCLMAWGVMGMLNVYGVFFTPMGEALGTGRGAVTLHMSLRALACGLASPLVAKLIEKKVNTKILMGVGMLVYLGSGIMIALSRSVILIDILAVVSGIALAFFSYMIITIILGNWFRRNLATFTGIAVSFSGIGGAIASPLVTKMLSVMEYRTVYIIYTFITVLMVLPMLFVSFYPEKVGLQPYGAGDKELAVNPLKKENYLNLPYKLVSPLMMVVLLITLLSVGLTSLNSHLPSLAISNGFTADVGAVLLSASMIGNLTSKFIVGLIIDRFGVFKGFLLVLLTCLSGLLIILFVKSGTAPLLIGGYLYGTVFSLGSLGLTMLARYLYGNAQYNQAYSKMTLVTSVSSAIFVYLIGVMYDLSTSYKPAVIMGISIAIALIFVTFGLMFKLGRKNVKTGRPPLG